MVRGEGLLQVEKPVDARPQEGRDGLHERLLLLSGEQLGLTGCALLGGVLAGPEVQY